jgi:HB1, ASXL, restriction endonuclease HTH domain
MPAKIPASKNRKPTRSNAKTAPIKKKAAKPSAAAPSQKLSALAAAARILAETKKPMSCPELIAAMADHGYWTSPTGKTPAATLSAALQREIVVKKDQARFQKTGPGRYALA